MSLYSAPKWRHWKPYTGPRSPSSRWVRPRLSRNSRDPFASQMWTPFSLSFFPLVQPCTNHSNSSATPRQKTRLVVSNGKESRRLYLGVYYDSVSIYINLYCRGTKFLNFVAYIQIVQFQFYKTIIFQYPLQLHSGVT